MASNYDITMRQFNGIDYDTLYPKTKLSQIDGLDAKFGDYYTKTETSNLFLPKAGGTMGGILDMNGNRISNLPAPSANSDPATKEYVDGVKEIKSWTLIKSKTVAESTSQYNSLIVPNNEFVQYDIPNIKAFKIKLVNFYVNSLPSNTSDVYVDFSTTSSGQTSNSILLGVYENPNGKIPDPSPTFSNEVIMKFHHKIYYKSYWRYVYFYSEGSATATLVIADVSTEATDREFYVYTAGSSTNYYRNFTIELYAGY